MIEHLWFNINDKYREFIHLFGGRAVDIAVEHIK